MKKSILITVAVVLALSACTEKYPQPVNPDASKEVKELLNMLYENRGVKILSGQHNYPRPGKLMESTDTVIARTGEIPVIWGGDFVNKQMRSDMLDTAISQFEKGHIITLMWHAPCPVDSIPDSIVPYRYMLSEQEWTDIITPGTKFNELLLADLDEVAEGLKSLQEKNIPVLWRPYHEMNGIWFWWGNKQGENGFPALWKIMYDRFTNHHGLNNLVWVWNTNAPRDWENDQAYAYGLFYPGPETVDVLAADIYKRDYKQSHHDDLLALADGKLIALGEIGLPPTSEELSNQPMWSWFMMWASWPITRVSPADLNELYHHELILNFDEFRK